MSSSAWKKLVEGSVELYAQTHSVAFSDPNAEGAWFHEQEDRIQREPEALMPRVQDLMTKAAVALEGFEPIPFDETLDDCESRNHGGQVREGPCIWELSVAPAGDSEANDTRVRIALGSYPPDRARGLFRWQLREVAGGASAHFPKAGTPWWIPVSAGGAVVVGITSFILMRRRKLAKRGN